MRPTRANTKKGGVWNTVRSLLTEKRTPAADDTFARLQARFGEEDVDTIAETVEVAVTAGRAALASGGENDGRPHNKFDP